MPSVSKTIENYLEAVEQVHGKAHRDQTRIHHAGGSDVVVQYPEGHRAIVGLGQLELMTEHLQRQATLKKAA